MGYASHRKKLLFVSHTAAWDGAERCLFRLVTGLNPAQFEAVVVLPEPGVLDEWLHQRGICTCQLALEWWSGMTGSDAEQHQRFRQGLAERVEALADFIRAERFDLVYSNTSVVADGALAAWRCAVPHVWHLHELLGLDLDLFPFLELADLYRLIHLLSDVVVVSSGSVQRHVEGFLGTGMTTLVYNGIEPPVRSGPSERAQCFGVDRDAAVVSFVGSLSRTKGVLQLVEAAPRVLERFPQARFLIAGADGGALAAFRQGLEVRRIGHAFRQLGYRPDPWNVIASSDLFVLPSLADCFPTVVLEAMLLEKPVVATRSGGAAEMVVDLDTGLLVPVNDPPALARALIRLLEDPARRHAMGRRGRERVETMFTTQRYVADLERVLAQAAGTDHRANRRGPQWQAAFWDLLVRAGEGREQLRRRRAELSGRWPGLESARDDLIREEDRVQDLERILEVFRDHFLSKAYRRFGSFRPRNLAACFDRGFARRTG